MVAAPTVSTLSSSLGIRLWATRGDNEGAKKKKRKRRRKDRPTTSDSSPLTPTSSPDPIKTSQEQIEGIDKIGDDLTDEDDGIASASSENESLQFEVSVGDGGKLHQLIGQSGVVSYLWQKYSPFAYTRNRRIEWARWQGRTSSIGGYCEI